MSDSTETKDQTTPEEEQGTMSFLEHLEELRGTLVKSLLAIVVGMLVMLPLAPQATRLLNWPVTKVGLDPATFLINLETIGMLKVFLLVGFWGGITLAAPFVLYYIGSFIFPGLHPHEKRAVRVGSFFAGLLFFVGAALGFGVSLPFFMQINLKIGAWMGYDTTSILIQDYVKTALKTVLAFGLSFELPVLVFILGYLGIVDSVQLRNKRKHVLVGILVLAMFLTPPDVVTQVILTIPLFLLYELTVWLVWLKERREGSTVGSPIDRESAPSLLIFLALAIGIAIYGFMNFGKTKEEGPLPGVNNPTVNAVPLESFQTLQKDFGVLADQVKALDSRLETQTGAMTELTGEALPAFRNSLDDLQKQMEAFETGLEALKQAPPPVPVPDPEPDPAP